MSEASLWDRMRRGVTAVARVDFQRVENMVEDGTPDVNYCCEHGREGWIELKYRQAIPKRAGTSVFRFKGLRDSQIDWIMRRVPYGGRVWILAQVGDHLLLVRGEYAEQFNEMTLAELMSASAWRHRGKSPDWLSFKNILNR